MTYRVAIWDEVPTSLLIGFHIAGVASAVALFVLAGASLIAASSMLAPLVALRVVLARPYDGSSSLTVEDDGLVVKYRGSKDLLTWPEIKSVRESTEQMYPNLFTWPLSIPNRYLKLEARRDIRMRRLPVFGANRLRITAQYQDDLERHIQDRIHVAAAAHDTG